MMTKHEFLDALKGRLTQLPPDELEKQLSYYAELIDDMTEDGIEEAQAVEKLGDISKISEEILQELPLPVLVNSRVRPGGGWTALSIVLLVLGSPIWLPILIALLAVVLAVYITIWAVIVALFAVVLSIALSGLALIIGTAWIVGHDLPLALMILGGGVACAGFSIFAFLGALIAAKGLVKLTGMIARWIKSLFIRKEAKK